MSRQSHQTLREWRYIAQGHRSGPNNGWHEGKIAGIQKVSRSRTGYRGRVPKPAATKADRSYNDGPDHNFDSLQIQRRYSNIVATLTPRLDRVDTLFATMFEQVQNVDDEISDEVEKYLSLSVVTLSSFIDVMEWWTAQKDVFLAHYQMAANYLGTLTTSTLSKRVNSVAGREFTIARQLLSSLLSSFVFIQTMCLRSWVDVGVIKVSSNRAKVVANIEKALDDGVTTHVAAIFDQITVEQDHWENRGP